MNAGDRNEIEKLYLQMYDMLFVYAKSILETDALAEEAVQDTFVIACRKPDDLLGNPNPAGWLVNTLKYVISNTVRSQNTAKRILSEFCAVNYRELTEMNDEQKLELLYENLAYKEEFMLLREMAIEGRSYGEMAQSRGISIEACRKRVQRAREYLKNKLKN